VLAGSNVVLAQADKSNGQQAPAAGKAEQRDEFAFPVRILSYPLDQQQADDAKKQTQRSEEREEENLTIQRDVAQSSEEVAHYTKLQFYLGVTGALGLFATVLFAAASAYYARHAVLEARKQVAFAQEGMRRQLRAYIGLEFIRKPSDAPDGFLAVSIRLKNSGQSPANILTIAHKVGGGTALRQTEFADITPRQMPMTVGAGAGATIAAANTLVRITDLREQVASGQLSLFAVVEIVYLDIFGQQHTSRFTRTMEGPRNIDSEFSFNPMYPDVVT